MISASVPSICFNAPAKILRNVFVVVCCLYLLGCSSTPPKKQSNICDIFEEKKSWYKDARKARDRWNIGISTNMAFIHQESRFRAKARPPRKRIFGFIPGPRKSSAYGYPQAKKSTWAWYRKSTGRGFADRHDFGDAIDFVGWYNNITAKTNGVSRSDAYSLYLAYHEGHTGYKRGSYKNKKWLRDVARKVDQRAKLYRSQLLKCEKELQSSGWWPF